MNILLTGDDGYNSIGTRILIHILKADHNLTVVGVKHQQSGVGGKLSLREGGTWGETTIDGVRAFWVSGTPADAMEFAFSRFGKTFDYLLSGVNLGENISTAIISSGTVGAAIRGLGLQVAPRGIAISWETPPEYYFLAHDEREDMTTYLAHPGENVAKVLKYCLDQNNFEADLLNINIPSKPASEMIISTLYTDSSIVYPPLTIRDDGSFAYPPEVSERQSSSQDSDLAILKSGEISVSPLTLDWTDYTVHSHIQEKTIHL